MGVKYSFPSNLHLSRECVDLISKVFQANPGNRISIAGIRMHPWFLKNLPEELLDGGRAAQVVYSLCKEIYQHPTLEWALPATLRGHCILPLLCFTRNLPSACNTCALKLHLRT